jgi:uncharacterized repeat protein (TIGR03803 family)
MFPRGASRGIQLIATIAIAQSIFGAGGNASAYTLKTLYSFCFEQNCADGYGPGGGLTRDAKGNLFGVTFGYDGEIFMLHPSPDGTKWTFSVLYRFCNQLRCTDGTNPNGHLVLDSAGNLYGTTSAGGANDGGIAFKLSPAPANAAWTLTVLSDFCFRKYRACTQPSSPASGLTYAGAENGMPYDGVSPLYGATRSGGPSDSGTAYRLTFKDGQWTQKLVYGFCQEMDCTDGGLPGALLVDFASNLYGATYDGGTGHQGTAYELAPNGHAWTETVLYNFCSTDGCLDGRNPGSLVSGDGFKHLSGVGGGGSNCDVSPYCGTLFRITANGANSKETVLYNFCSAKHCRDGTLPSGIAVDATGQIFGTTEFGGANKGQQAGNLRAGTLFAFDGKFHQLYNFCSEADCADGEEPLGGPAMDAAGNVFGVTFYGGSGAYRNDTAGGTIFELVK